MSGRRKDHKGRVLKEGESQRKDHKYQFRYRDLHGKRQTIYANDLNTLREKEKVIRKMLDEEIDYSLETGRSLQHEGGVSFCAESGEERRLRQHVRL